MYFSAFYNYKNLYSFNFNTRMDASNKFGEQSNDKMLPVWSVSGRWNIAEDLFSNVAWVNDLNMRASFGYQGNMLGIGPELVIEKGELNPNHNKYGSTVFNYHESQLEVGENVVCEWAGRFRLFPQSSGWVGKLFLQAYDGCLYK